MKPSDHDGRYISTVDGHPSLDGTLEISNNGSTFFYTFEDKADSEDGVTKRNGLHIEFTLKKDCLFKGDLLSGIKKHYKGTVHISGRSHDQDPTWTAST